MKRFLLFAAVLAGFWVVVGSASASIFTDGISFDGIKDTIHDNSVALALFDNNDDDEIGQGDVIAGLLKWNTNNSDGVDFAATTHTFFVAQIDTGPNYSTNITGGNPHLQFMLVPVPDSGTGLGYSLAELLPNQDLAVGGFSDQTIGATFSAPGGANLTLTDVFSAQAALDTTATWGFDFSFGMVADTDYFEVELQDTDGDGAIDIGDSDGDGIINEYQGLAAGVGVGLEAGAFSAILDTWPGLTWLPVQADDLGGVNPSKDTTADIALLNSTSLNIPEDDETTDGWIFSNQAKAALNVTPEPASCVVWALMFVTVAGFGVWRRRKK